MLTDGTFERLLRHQSPIYHGWTSIKACAQEEFQAVLWCLRTGRPSFDSRDVRAEAGLDTTNAGPNP
jgi:hypothetical protein